MLNNDVKNKLDFLHADARKDPMRMAKGLAKSILRPMQPADFEQAYLPISKAQGETIHQMVVDQGCKNIVEFGTSFGISTLYFADAARETGGRVVTTELLESKAGVARKNIEEAGLSDYVDFRIGDAMETLSGYSDPVDFLFLDGWKNLYLPLFQMLEPLFHAGTLIYADNMDMADTREYADYVKKKGDVYATESIHHGKAFLTRLV